MAFLYTRWDKNRVYNPLEYTEYPATYVYLCIQTTVAGESPVTTPLKWRLAFATIPGTVISIGSALPILAVPNPITAMGTITTSMSTNMLIGRYSAGTGIMQEITIGSGLTLSAGGILSSAAGTVGWLLDGNTVGSEKWIGTADTFDFPFRTNNTEKMKLTTGGQLQVGRTGAAVTVSMLKLQNNLAASDFYTSNATPESAITANTGDFCLVDTGSAGTAYIKATGTASNTGWLPLLTSSAVSLPLNEIAYGTGSGITSSSDFTWNQATGLFSVGTLGGTYENIFKANGSDYSITIFDYIAGIDNGNGIFMSQSTGVFESVFGFGMTFNGLFRVGDVNNGYDAGAIQLANIGGNVVPLQFLERSVNGLNYVAFKAPDAITTSQTYTWPSSVGAAGSVLTDAAGDGTLSWAAGASSTAWLLNGNSLSNDTTWIGSSSNNDFLIKTNNTTRASWFKTGELGIGITASPLGTLHVKGKGSSQSSLYAINNAGTNSFEYRDSGQIYRNGFLYSVVAGSTSDPNTSWGINALGSLTSGVRMVAVGNGAGGAQVSGTSSSYFGAGAGRDHTASFSVFVGELSGCLTVAGASFVAVGARALCSQNALVGITSGQLVTAIGTSAGQRGTSASVNNSTYIGTQTVSEGSNEVIIGGVGNTDFYFGMGKFGTTSLPSIYNIKFQPTSPATGGTFYSNVTDGNGINWTFGVSQATGSGTSGDIIWQYAPSGSTGTTQTTLTTGMTFKGTTGQLQVGTAAGAVTVSMFQLKNTGTTIDFYTSNATPEGAITGGRGDIVLVDDATDGEGYLKTTGTGNTGWGQIIAATAVTTETVVSDTTLTIKYNGVTYKLLALA